MLTLRSIGIAIAMLCSLFLFGMVSSSEAASITSLSSYATADWGNGGYVGASLTADEDIYVIDWYIDNTRIKTTDHYHSPTRSVYVYLDTHTGGIKGVKYEVKAVAWFSDVENNTFISNTETSDVRVYAPKYVSSIKQPTWEKPTVTGVFGYSELSRHYHDGQNIVVDGYVYASNRTDNTCHAKSWFRHTEYNANLFPTGWEEQDPPINAPNPATEVGPGESYSNSGSSSISYPVGGDIQSGQFITLNAHIPLKWLETGQQIPGTITIGRIRLRKKTINNR